MDLYPEVVAGYDAARELLADTTVTVRDPNVLPGIPSDPIELLGSFPPAYSVLAMPLPEGINMVRHGKFGFIATTRLVEYPVPHDDAEFTAKLKEVLMLVVEEFLAEAAADEKRQRAESPEGIHESREAIREIK